jgi:hypothetical protein
MNGITILDSIDIYQASGWQSLITLIPFLITTVIFFVRMHIAFKKGTPEEQARSVITNNNWSLAELLILVGGAVLSFILGDYIDIHCPTKYVETHYEIAIDDSASFNEVYDKYIIIEEKEDTFIVREK